MPLVRRERVKRWRNMSISKFTTIDAFFVNMNRAAFRRLPLNSPRQRCLPHLLLRWWRSTMLTCLQLVTEMLLARCSDQARLRSTSKLSLIQAPIHINNRHVLPQQFLSCLSERKLKWQANHEQLGCTHSSKLFFFQI